MHSLRQGVLLHLVEVFRKGSLKTYYQPLKVYMIQAYVIEMRVYSRHTIRPLLWLCIQKYIVVQWHHCLAKARNSISKRA
jgi:hypothetical protein